MNENSASRRNVMAPTSTIARNINELVVQLSRRNGEPAQNLAMCVQADLNNVLTSGLDATNILRRQAQQTMYAIEEVLALIEQNDLRGAWQAARDASKEWRAVADAQD